MEAKTKSTILKTIIHYIDRLNAALGSFASWSTLLLVLLVCLDVVLRYFFQWSRVWMMELEMYLFAIIFLLGSAYAFQMDRHVRVDVFYSNMSIKKQAFVNIVGGLIFLLPWTLVMIYISQRYFLKSLRIGESSSQPGGLPALYLLKCLLLLGFFLLFLQGISSIYKSLIELKKNF